MIFNRLRSFTIRVLLLAAGGGCLWGCQKQDMLEVTYHREYYPLATGHYITYEVDSIQYSFSENPDTYVRDTIRYQLKELVTDTFYDNENELNYRLELQRRYDTLSPFSIWKIWSVKADAYNLQKNEDDIRFIKLIFPPKENETWNGNLYVPQTDIYRIFRNWNYGYSLVHEPYSAGGLNLDSTLTVLQVDDEDLIEKTLRREVYAKNIGMVYQEWEHLTKQKVQLNWQNGPENGFRIRMKAIDWN